MYDVPSIGSKLRNECRKCYTKELPIYHCMLHFTISICQRMPAICNQTYLDRKLTECIKPAQLMVLIELAPEYVLRTPYGPPLTPGPARQIIRGRDTRTAGRGRNPPS